MIIVNILITLGYVGLFCYVSLNNEVNLDFAQNLYYVLFKVTLAPGPITSILCVCFVALNLTSEFHNGTVELIISSGIKRISFVFSKLFACILGGLILYAIHSIIGVTLFGVVSGWDKSLSVIGFYPVFRGICLSFTAIAASMAVAFFYSMLWRNTAGAVITVLAANQVINWTIGKIPLLNNLLKFYPDNMLVNIAIQVDTTDGLFLIITSLAFIVIMFLGSYLILKNCDVKG